MREYIRECFTEHIDILEKQKNEFVEKVFSFSQMLVSAFQTKNKILLAGNGGSAADAQHIAAEFVGRFMLKRPSLPAIALTTDTSVLTSVGNDFGFEKIFSRQIEGLGKSGDILILLSTSGNSENLLQAASAAKKMSINTIGFLGKDGGKLAGVLDGSIVVATQNTPRIQEMHITIGHILCDMVEREMQI